MVPERILEIDEQELFIFKELIAKETSAE